MQATILVLLAIPAALFIVILAGACYQVVGSLLDERLHPPRGRLVDVGGYRLHISVEGEGSPTVVLDAGLAHTSQVWNFVQPEVAKFTRVCSYDRAGYGWSDPGPLPRSSQQIVQELHTLLRNADIPGPYLLVGHSFGGLNMYLYAVQYPDEVAGLVLLDAVSINILTDNPWEFLYFLRVNRIKYRLLAVLNRLGLFRLYILLRGPGATMDFIRRLPTKLQHTVLSDFMRKTFEAAANESAAMEEGIRRAKEMYAVHTPLAIPLIVLSHGIPDMFTRRMSVEESAEAEQRWQKLQAAIASLSSQGKLLIASKSGHKIHIDEPELVVDVIQRLCLGEKRS